MAQYAVWQLIEFAQWLPFHQTTHQTENVILWVRGDLFRHETENDAVRHPSIAGWEIRDN